jgi:hypothetical protein
MSFFGLFGSFGFCVSLVFRSDSSMNETNSISQTNEMNQFGFSLRRGESLQPQQSHESLRPRQAY